MVPCSIFHGPPPREYTWRFARHFVELIPDFRESSRVSIPPAVHGLQNRNHMFFGDVFQLIGFYNITACCFQGPISFPFGAVQEQDLWHGLGWPCWSPGCNYLLPGFQTASNSYWVAPMATNVHLKVQLVCLDVACGRKTIAQISHGHAQNISCVDWFHLHDLFSCPIFFLCHAPWVFFMPHEFFHAPWFFSCPMIFFHAPGCFFSYPMIFFHAPWFFFTLSCVMKKWLKSRNLRGGNGRSRGGNARSRGGNGRSCFSASPRNTFLGHGPPFSVPYVFIVDTHGWLSFDETRAWFGSSRRWCCFTERTGSTSGVRFGSKFDLRNSYNSMVFHPCPRLHDPPWGQSLFGRNWRTSLRRRLWVQLSLRLLVIRASIVFKL